MHCRTAWGQWPVGLLRHTTPLPWGQWAVGLLQDTAFLPGGQWAVDLLQDTAFLPGGSGQWNVRNALPQRRGDNGQRKS